MTDVFGLQPGEIEKIVAVLSTEPAVKEAFIFGSRAKGNYNNGSDVDIALKGTQLNFDKVISLSFILNEETLMPYHFDLVHYNTINTPELIDHIDRVGIKIYG